MKFELTQAKRKHIKEIAKRLPRATYKVRSRRRFSGSELLQILSPEQREQWVSEKGPIVPSEQYRHRVDDQKQVNHFQRMVKKYKKYGDVGLRAYVDQYKPEVPKAGRVRRWLQKVLFDLWMWFGGLIKRI